MFPAEANRAQCPLKPRTPGRGIRRIRGIAAQTLFPAFQLAHANRRKPASWAGAIALGDERPRRRPTHRRRTKPLSAWTPGGHITRS